MAIQSEPNTDIIQHVYDYFSGVDEKIVHGVIVAVIISILGYVIKLLLRYFHNKFKQKYAYLFGEYHGYFFLRDNITLVYLKCIIKPILYRKVSAFLEEKNQAGYQYEGTVDIESDMLYSYMRGKRQDDRALLICRIPFNHRNELVAMDGILAGINQKKEPSATRILLSRVPLSEIDLKEEFGRHNARIICDTTPELMKDFEIAEMD